MQPGSVVRHKTYGLGTIQPRTGHTLPDHEVVRFYQTPEGEAGRDGKTLRLPRRNLEEVETSYSPLQPDTPKERSRQAAREGFTHYTTIHHRMEGADCASAVWSEVVEKKNDAINGLLNAISANAAPDLLAAAVREAEEALQLA